LTTDRRRPIRQQLVKASRARQNIHEFVTINQSSAELSYSVHAPAGSAAIAVYASLIAAGLAFRWLCSAHATLLPFWAPWDFSWVEFLAAWLVVWWYLRGLARLAPEQRPSLRRSMTFFAGVLVIYAVLETRFEYFAEHQFFYNRIQHVVMHHLGPMLIALAWPGTTLWQGMPEPVRRAVAHPAARRTVRVLQQPVLAALLFSGSFFFWLIPSVHFRAMIDPDLYSAMNWTMVVEGLLFWCLVLDPRPAPPARASFAARAALAFVVMFPQIAIGALITFTTRDLYSFYDLCGRIYPDLGPRIDQAIGGLIVWIPPAMMSIVALLLVLNALRRVEEQSLKEGVDHDDIASETVQAAQWTGR
jgi:putative membrane protein